MILKPVQLDSRSAEHRRSGGAGGRFDHEMRPAEQHQCGAGDRTAADAGQVDGARQPRPEVFHEVRDQRDVGAERRRRRCGASGGGQHCAGQRREEGAQIGGALQDGVHGQERMQGHVEAVRVLPCVVDRALEVAAVLWRKGNVKLLAHCVCGLR